MLMLSSLKGSLIEFYDLHNLRVPGGVQHGVWTRLQSFLIIRESIDITTSEIECFHKYWNSASRTPRYPLKNNVFMVVIQSPLL